MRLDCQLYFKDITTTFEIYDHLHDFLLDHGDSFTLVMSSGVVFEDRKEYHTLNVTIDSPTDNLWKIVNNLKETYPDDLMNLYKT